MTVIHGDSLDVLATLDSASIDAVVTDPPYGIGFMGHQWDQPGEFGPVRRNGRNGGANGGQWDRPRRTGPADRGSVVAGSYDFSATANRRFQAWCEAWAAECLRILKPGGHLLSFCGTRTWHRMTAGVEDAGFEIRDTLAWLYGSGFPKSLDVGKAIDKAAGAEREFLGHRTDGRYAHGFSEQAKHALGNVVAEANQAGFSGDMGVITAPDTDEAAQWDGWGTALKPAFEPIVVARKPLAGTVAANVLEHGTGALNIDACRIGSEGGTRRDGKADQPTAAGWSNMRGIAPVDGGRWPANVVLDEDAAALLDRQTGTLTSGSAAEGGHRRNTDKHRNTYGTFPGHTVEPTVLYGDSGGASRFFYCAKASTAERGTGNNHPTVKPIDLMRWLVRLVTPPGGTVLDPFAGSGTTLIAATIEGFTAVGIEREAEYVDIIRRRLAQPLQPVLGGMA